jgi:hypothetical protein
MQFLDIQQQPFRNPHQIWKLVPNNTLEIKKKAEIKAKLLTRTYTLQSDRAKFGVTTNISCTKSPSWLILLIAFDPKLLAMYVKSIDECFSLTFLRDGHISRKCSVSSLLLLHNIQMSFVVTPNLALSDCKVYVRVSSLALISAFFFISSVLF